MLQDLTSLVTLDNVQAMLVFLNLISIYLLNYLSSYNDFKITIKGSKC